MYKAIVTIMIESDKQIDTNYVHDLICQNLCEDRVLDNNDFQVTHVFDVPEVPND